MKKPSLKKDYLVEKRNILNEMKAKGWTLQELRFFSIYLSRINPRDLATRRVRFSVPDFQDLMGLKRTQSKDIKPTIDSLLNKIVYSPVVEDGIYRGYNAFQLFKECSVLQGNSGGWYIEIEAHDKALPLMFDYKRQYFNYKLGNVLGLTGRNQFRMYEILKQYEYLGEMIVSYGDLKEMLGVGPDEYMNKATGKHRWNNFKIKVLDDCQKVLAEKTDIKFTYMAETRGGLKKTIVFKIEANADHDGTPDTCTGLAPRLVVLPHFKNDRLGFLADACETEFNEAEMQVLYNLLKQIITHEIGEGVDAADRKMYIHLKSRYDELVMQAGRRVIKSRFGYLKKILEADCEDKDCEDEN